MTQDRDKLEQLLADRATEGLSSEKEQELATLTSSQPVPSLDEWQLAAAAIHCALAGPVREELPSHLRERVLTQARAQGSATAAAADEPVRAPRPSAGPTRPRGLVVELSGWLVAAAAIVVAVLLMPNGGPPSPQSDSAALARLREALLAEEGTVRWSWIPGNTVSAVGGDVVWNDRLGEGYMVFEGVPANDPKSTQYQLWIFDKKRGDQYPVDGGVFDLGPSEGEVAAKQIVRIDPKLMVDEAFMFAVTEEEPGGVVVSDRSRVTALAKP